MQGRRRARARVCTTLAAVAAMLVPAVLATADPVRDIVDPPRRLASVLPTPLDDPFYTPPPGWEGRAPGALLAARAVPHWLPTPVRSVELLLGSTDARGRPAPVVATLYTPTAPWAGPGRRPLISYNIPTSSLGNTCAPSYQLKQGIQADLWSIQLLLAANYAVLVPDHQGPRQAYAAGHMGGHAVLDAVRAAVRLGLPDLTPDSPIVLSGYSGGAIATGWAAELAPAYAPELSLAGALIGGLPADYGQLVRTMSGNAATGVFLAATLGLAREYPQLLTLLNDNGWRLAHALRDACVTVEAALGFIAPITLDVLTDHPDPLALPMVRKIVADNTLGTLAPKIPVLLYHGVDEFWIPLAGAQEVYDDWCRSGARVRLQVMPGEHFTVGAVAVPALARWADDLIAGRLVPDGCSRSVG
ncbi:lipase family protein [Nocardia sp. CC227C]|uniref:lipase family protein n=1 Tax=Nocardia sp. CC227C TaxID=3044562 RepID=UPI00278BD5EC|nr:lipase family protein [Nocardia sp. CC227C]